MSDAFESSRYRIKHAKGHITKLEGEIRGWVASNPYARVIESNADGTKDIHKMKLVKPLPDPLDGIAFDIVSNLRSALDLAGYATAKAAGGSTRKAKFPFGLNIIEVKSRATNGSKDVPKEIFDVMVSRQPYKGGNDLLWALNELCNTNKHEVVVGMPLSTTVSNMQFGGDVMIDSLEWPPRWDAAKNEMIIVTVPHGHNPHYKLNFTGFVAIGDVDAIRGQPALGVLNGMLTEVQNSLTAIEAEALRLGIVH